MSVSQLQDESRFGDYRLLRRFAAGGMAELFEARWCRPEGELSVVVKRILPTLLDDPAARGMFASEAQLCAYLQHPNVVTVHDTGAVDGHPYIAMEYVRGLDCRQLWCRLAERRQRLPVALAAYITGELLAALEQVHRCADSQGRPLKVVHGDVSPSNILISRTGAVKLSDFGVAQGNHHTRQSNGRQLRGKYAYLSPEQVAGGETDSRGDIFAAGVVLCELLLGRRLFLGRNTAETLEKVVNVDTSLLDQSGDMLDAELRKVIKRALRKQPKARYGSAASMHRDLQDYCEAKRLNGSATTLSAFLELHESRLFQL